MSECTIDHPSYYGGENMYECINVLENWLPQSEYIGFLRGNIIKYLCRCEKKESFLTDIRKAEWYIHVLRRFIETKFV